MIRPRFWLAVAALLLAHLPSELPAQTDSNSASATPTPPPPLSPVIWSEHPDIIQRFAVTSDPTVRSMVNQALMKLTSAQDIATAWQRLGITPDDTVGIKISTQGGVLCSSHRSIINAICEGVEAVGVPAAHIIVWDKDARDMRSAGYAPTDSGNNGVAIRSVFPGTGYDPESYYTNDVSGSLIWGDSEFLGSTDLLTRSIQDAVRRKGYTDDGTPSLSSLTDNTSLPAADAVQLSKKSHFARLISTLCTKIINVPVLVDNPNIGMQGCIGSLALGSVDNNRRFQGEPSYGDPALCEILQQPVLRRKVVVHILDALVAQYAGGPRFDPQFTRSIGAIYVSRDPVAIDSLVIKRLEQWRASDRNGRIDPIGKTASHIHTAAILNLGTDDPGLIQLIKIP